MKTWTKKNIFLDELHLDDVLEVLLVVGSEIYQHITCIQIPKKELEKKDNMILPDDMIPSLQNFT